MENGYDDFGNLQKKKLKPVHGILLFVLVMASYYTIIAWMQMKFGMYGLAMTELYLLLLSVGITDRKSTRLNSSHSAKSRMPSSA